ncbi:DUF6517 family protein [Natronoarchaeum sp. GCM10025321]|uniref:DUF6517 family protein n=1 Tax=Natronoarchaeum sp. GCM10025321 TaxID=3252684 RepID=UPI00361E1B72
MNRRHFLAGAGAFGLASISGCLGLAGLDEHEATPGGVDAETREETGYEQVGIEELPVEESVGLGPATESVRVANYMTKHERSVDMGPLGEQRGAVFMILSTPQIGIPNYQFNPVEDMSTRELIDLVDDNYDGIDDIQHEEDGTASILDQSTTVSRFSASAQFDGEDVEVYLHVSKAVETDDDLLVTIGVYPELVRSEEEGNVEALMSGVVEHADSGDEGADSTSNDGDDGGDTTDDGEDEDGGLL